MRNFGTSTGLGYYPSTTKFHTASIWAISMVDNIEERNVFISRKKGKDKLSKNMTNYFNCNTSYGRQNKGPRAPCGIRPYFA